MMQNMRDAKLLRREEVVFSGYVTVLRWLKALAIQAIRTKKIP